MSLAALKRKIKVGTYLKMTRHDWFPNSSMTVQGNLGTTQLKGALVGTVRPVVYAKTTGIGLKTGNNVSCMDWPPANSVRETQNGFEIDLNRTGEFKEVMAYEFVSNSELRQLVLDGKVEVPDDVTAIIAAH